MKKRITPLTDLVAVYTEKDRILSVKNKFFTRKFVLAPKLAG